MANQCPPWSIDGASPLNKGNPLVALAAIAASVSQQQIQTPIIGPIVGPIVGITKAQSTCVVTPPSQHGARTPTPAPTPPTNSMQHLRFVLRRPVTSSPWGLTVSMLDSKYLILGYVEPALTLQYTIFAGPLVPTYRPALPIQLLHPGDVIRSINERPISSFPSFAAVAEYLRQNTFLSIVILRASGLPQSIIRCDRPENSYWAAEQTHLLLKRELQTIVKPSPQKRVVSNDVATFQINKQRPKPPAKPMNASKPKPKILPFLFTNPLFRDDAGKAIPYDDDFEFTPEDGTRASQFLASVDCFDNWLVARKESWRKRWKVYQLKDVVEDAEDDSPTHVQKDFWSPQGFASFNDWCGSRTAEWKRGYSWNKRKRKRIAETAEEVVHFPSQSDGDEAFGGWLRVRKNQWRILRRKRQRRLEQKLKAADEISVNQVEEIGDRSETKETSLTHPAVCIPTTGEMLLIDSMLEEQERKRQEHRKTFDLAFVFDGKLGAPDDVIAHCMRYLHPSEHGKLLCVSAKTSAAMKQRDEMWRQLCPAHWILPRRPRKKWHDLYISKMRQEEGASRKRSDDLLSRIAAVLFKGDHFLKIEKLVAEGEQKFSFDVNYMSGVVCERNSMLNLAVINGRYKVARWLVETKGAALESHDRGGFTPLLNAAWDGNIKIVRFLMSKGCDRSKIGTNHYTRPMAGISFKGHTAEGWAREREHHDLADLIKQGL